MNAIALYRYGAAGIQHCMNALKRYGMAAGAAALVAGVSKGSVVSAASRPPIDAAVPAKLERAVFALG